MNGYYRNDWAGIAEIGTRSGKVKTGQKVNIRLQNFPENEYGILRGIVTNVSLVPVQTGDAVYYAVEVSLPDNLVTTY